MITEIDRRIRHALAGIRLAFRGVFSRVDSAPVVALVYGEGLSGEAIVAAEMMQDYGLATVPPPGFMGVCIPVGGRTAHSVIVATEHASYRLRGLASGDVALYTQANGSGIGHRVLLRADGTIEVRGTDIDIEASGELRLAGEDVVVHGSHSFSWDVNGFGERWTSLGGSEWERKTWQIGATVTVDPLSINPPEGP